MTILIFTFGWVTGIVTIILISIVMVLADRLNRAVRIYDCLYPFGSEDDQREEAQ